MIQLSFPTKKLKKYIKRVNVKLKDTNYNQNDLTVYGVTNTEGITITGNQTSEDLSNYIVFKENQLAYNPYRVNVGSIGLAPKGLLGLVSPAYVVFETTKDLNAEFLYYYLKSSLGINLIKWYGDRGGVRSALRYDDLCEIDIPDLNLIQQMSVLNRMKEANKEIEKFNSEVYYQEQLISKLRQSILQEAVQGKLVPQNPDDEPASILLERIKEEKERLIKEGKIKKEKPLPPITEDEIPYELPVGWEWCRLQEAIDVRDGTHDTPKYVESGGYPLVTGKDFYSGKLEFSQTKYISKEDYEKIILRSKVDRGDILFSMIGGNIGSMVIFEEDIEIAIKNVALFKKYYEGSVDNKYLFYFLKANINNIKTLSKGGAQPFVSLNILRNYLFALPPFEEQKRIVEKVDQLMALCDELEKNIEQSKKDSELLMQSVLQEAFKEA